MTSPESSVPAAGDPRVAEIASDLRVVVGQLVRRFRQDRTVPQPQLAAMGWLHREGARTTSQLAALERVRPQSMAQTVAQLESAGLIERRPDPSDGRQSLIDLTPAGRETMEQFRLAGESWVSEAIAARLTPAELAELERGIALLARLVNEPADRPG